MTLLRAYFDENGTHVGSPAIFIAGLIGSTEEWDKVSSEWQNAMNGEIFHYTARYTESELLDKLAEVISASNLEIIGNGFCGDWKKAISTQGDWGKRFPSAYSFSFEMCIEHITREAPKLWPHSEIELIFSEQNQYEKRAEEVWRTFQGNGLWQNLSSFGYQSPKTSPELQMADMVVHETFQCMKANTPESWHKWPLMKRLMKSDNTMLGGYHTEETLIEIIKQTEKNGRQYLKKVPK